ncbi:MAG: YcxB family protein [Oscillospiraceae bacterium]|nr:YcxB family protein [Oscillospiraceae bacterium]
MFQITYDNNIPEIKRAYTLFRRKYTLRKMIVPVILCLITIVFGVDFIRRDAVDFKGYVLLALGAAMLFSLFLRPFTAQKKLVSTIEAMGEEKYTARFFDDKIEVDTEIIPEEAETEIVAVTKHGACVVENPEVLEEAKEQLTQPETSVIGLATEELYSVEDEEVFCLFVNKALIYIFPKRCMSAEQITELQKYFKDKAI